MRHIAVAVAVMVASGCSRLPAPSVPAHERQAALTGADTLVQLQTDLSNISIESVDATVIDMANGVYHESGNISLSSGVVFPYDYAAPTELVPTSLVLMISGAGSTAPSAAPLVRSLAAQGYVVLCPYWWVMPRGFFAPDVHQDIVYMGVLQSAFAAQLLVGADPRLAASHGYVIHATSWGGIIGQWVATIDEHAAGVVLLRSTSDLVGQWGEGPTAAGLASPDDLEYLQPILAQMRSIPVVFDLVSRDEAWPLQISYEAAPSSAWVRITPNLGHGEWPASAPNSWDGIGVVLRGQVAMPAVPVVTVTRRNNFKVTVTVAPGAAGDTIESVHVTQGQPYPSAYFTNAGPGPRDLDLDERLPARWIVNARSAAGGARSFLVVTED